MRGFQSENFWILNGRDINGILSKIGTSGSTYK
jgi:hypothetical protein